MVEERLKRVQLEVRRKKNLEEQRMRERQREVDRQTLEQRSRGSGVVDLSGVTVGGGDMTEEGRRWQMQIQEDVSFCVSFVYYLFATFISGLSLHCNNSQYQFNNYNNITSELTKKS